MLFTNHDRTARLRYGPNDFRVLSPGNHVLCAVTGEAVPLDLLRYWSVEHQEPYASAEIAVQAHIDRL